ncbi:hypothetical protein C2S52_015561 [Perilla frutescens var. hirtella]|nr:hypothetical protein C2S52_015561 [Perilla frutescens var. hirtella]
MWLVPPSISTPHDGKIENMEVSLIKLSYHNRGKWVLFKHAQYAGGKKLVENGDIDFLSFTHMIKKYKQEFRMHEVNKLVYLKPGKKLSDNALMILESDDGINDIVASVLEMNYDDFIHIYPYDELVLNHKKSVLVDEIVVNQPDLSTQASANLMCEAPDLGLNTNEIDMGVGLQGGKRVVNRDKGKQLAEDNESKASEFGQDGSESESGDLSVDSSSESSDSSYDDDDNEVEMQIINQSKSVVKYDGDEGNPFFLLGVTFANAEEARLAIARYSVARSTPLKLNPNEKGRIRAQCKGVGCPFYLWMSYCQNKPPLVVKKFNSEHNSLKDAKNNLASAKFLAQEFKKIINEKPTTTVKELLKTVEDKMYLYVSKSTCKRAKSLVRNELDGSYISEFAKIGAYVAMCKETNPGSTVELELQEEALHSGKFGLVHAVQKVLPLTEHRYCARHVHANWSKKWHSGELKKKFWACVWSTFKEEFDDNLKMLGSISTRAAEDFVAYNPQAACMATYQYPMKPMKSLKYLRVDDFAKCEPPPTVRLSGRPRVKRMRSGKEKMKGNQSGNLTKKGVVIKCSICHVAGHNAVTCPDKKCDAKWKSKATDAPKCMRKTRRVVGMGLHIDDSTLNPGMSSESIIHQRDPIASQSLSSDPDPVTRFPVPNQRELRQEQRASRSSASRRIAFVATGNQAILPTNLPFKPPGPTWKGLPCTSRTALEKQRDAKKNKLKK